MACKCGGQLWLHEILEALLQVLRSPSMQRGCMTGGTLHDKLSEDNPNTGDRSPHSVGLLRCRQRLSSTRGRAQVISRQSQQAAPESNAHYPVGHPNWNMLWQ